MSALPFLVVECIQRPPTILPIVLIRVARYPDQLMKLQMNCVSPFAVATFGRVGPV